CWRSPAWCGHSPSDEEHMEKTTARGKQQEDLPAARFALAEALEAIPSGVPVPYARVFAHGSMGLEIYAPVGRDNQRPHRQDELYVVMRGRGSFVNGDRRHPFAPGDVLFVPARVDHRFEDFSRDLAVWVVFYGADGGEAAAPHPAPQGELRWSLSDALRSIAADAQLRSVPVFEHGSLTLKLYNPRKFDPQTPHTRDELYVIQKGKGRFLCGGRSSPFAPGDALFAPAGAEHRFEGFGRELVTWVVFYGPEGGEG
ncbi:MAG TPA: cupin domain-containing protein, partial [Alphaproteobacteria bacterium]|nr:cupin domain-containing protein [Alphaproteobacteria bacterium]